jgi:hypothetical protein
MSVKIAEIGRFSACEFTEVAVSGKEQSPFGRRIEYSKALMGPEQSLSSAAIRRFR